MTSRHANCMTSPTVHLIPGWQGAREGHWLRHWSEQLGDTLLEQDDWVWPKRGDWMSQLELAVAAQSGPVCLVAEGLGCHLVDAWSAHSTRSTQVCAALLVAPPDLDQDGLPPQFAGWRRSVRRPLPFRSGLIARSDDPMCTLEQAQAMARTWDSDWLGSAPAAGAEGHALLADPAQARQWLLRAAAAL